ncbi:transglycosylase SLT domain-containing protein [candidate division KSB1 bacterium]|nr:transglycosylase SLT domain-containing protein [candidate division KSB1 bacterium]
MMKATPFDLKKIMTILTIHVFVIFLGVVWWINGQMTPKPSMSIDEIKRQVDLQKDVISIDRVSSGTQNKVLNIISRYNPEMPDSLKVSIAQEIFAMSQKYPNLNVDFICATITHESAKTWEPTVTSRAGAKGLMQIMPATGAFLAVEEGLAWTSSDEILFDPIINIRLGCRYLSHLVNMYEHDGGLAAYNGGPHRAELWLESNRNNKILYAETRSYVPAVLKLYDEFREQDFM